MKNILNRIESGVQSKTVWFGTGEGHKLINGDKLFLVSQESEAKALFAEGFDETYQINPTNALANLRLATNQSWSFASMVVFNQMPQLEDAIKIGRWVMGFALVIIRTQDLPVEDNEFCFRVGLRPLQYIFDEYDTEWLVAMKDWMIEEPVVKAFCYKAKTESPLKSNLKAFRGKTFPQFSESHLPKWKSDAMLQGSGLYNKVMSGLNEPKFAGGSIMPPNKEQTMVLIASGRLNSEVELTDGTLMVFKGTERIEYETRLATDPEGQPKYERQIQVRKPVLYGLDLTRGEMVQFT